MPQHHSTVNISAPTNLSIPLPVKPEEVSQWSDAHPCCLADGMRRDHPNCGKCPDMHKVAMYERRTDFVRLVWIEAGATMLWTIETSGQGIAQHEERHVNPVLAPHMKTMLVGPRIVPGGFGGSPLRRVQRSRPSGLPSKSRARRRRFDSRNGLHSKNTLQNRPGTPQGRSRGQPCGRSHTVHSVTG